MTTETPQETGRRWRAIECLGALTALIARRKAEGGAPTDF
jgi:hypothetical protein